MARGIYGSLFARGACYTSFLNPRTAGEAGVVAHLATPLMMVLLNDGAAEHACTTGSS